VAHHIDNNDSIIVFDQTAHEQVTASVSVLAINDPAPVAHLDKKLPSLPNAIMQADLGLTESEPNPLVSCLHHVFAAFAYD